MRKTQPRKVSKFTHDHLVSKWHGQDLNPGHLGPKFMHFIIVLCSPPHEPLAQVRRGRACGGPVSSAARPAAWLPPGAPLSTQTPEPLVLASQKSPGPGTLL